MLYFRTNRAEVLTLIELLKKYKHGLIIPLYALIYIPWFGFLERTVTNPEHIIHVAFDDLIPFVEIFIIPYMLWFLYIAVTVLYFLFKDRSEFYRLMIFLIIGMTVFLIVSTVYPNGHDLRPETFDHTNVFTQMIAKLYRTDSPNNILPSIHVFNSLGAWFALQNSRFLADRKGIRLVSFLMTGLIILSTVLIKQHSILDVILAFLLADALYPVFYMPKSPVFYRNIRRKLHIWMPKISDTENGNRPF